MTHPTPADWAGLCARTETDRPHEWAPVLWVIRNRIDSARYPQTAEDVVRQPWQFSAFNPTRSFPPQMAYEHVRRHYTGSLLTEAVLLAEEVLAVSRSRAPFSPQVFNFWSPRSMLPAGSLPRGWRWSELRCFHLDDPWRFVFAETVGRGHPLSGNAGQYDFRRHLEGGEVTA